MASISPATRRHALGLLAGGILEAVALGGEVGERGGNVGENLLGGGKLGVGLGEAPIDPAAAAGAFARFFADGFFLGGELAERCLRVGGELLLALDVGGELLEPQIEFGDAVLGALLLAVEVLLGDVKAMQGGARARLGLAQFRQRGGRQRLAFGGFGFGAGAVGNRRARTSPWRARLR